MEIYIHTKRLLAGIIGIPLFLTVPITVFAQTEVLPINSRLRGIVTYSNRTNHQLK
jgi:hypothetical protein